MYIDYCRLMSGDQGLIPFNSFVEQEFLITREILDARSKLNQKIMDELDTKSGKQKM